MAGAPAFIYEGGIGAMPSLTSSPSRGSGIGSAPFAQAHNGAIVLVLVAVLLLVALDRFGFRFAVTAGRR